MKKQETIKQRRFDCEFYEHCLTKIALKTVFNDNFCKECERYIKKTTDIIDHVASIRTDSVFNQTFIDGTQY